MLELKNIVKIYSTGENKVKALKGVSINFRKCEFVSVLGPSGCGKTTMLNIVGGLDRYTYGDLVINGVSTKNYADSDWDAYRNHSVGFVFQSYNLIPHQTVEKNVELALTLSGVRKEERMKRAREALEKVGLKDHFKKLPNQLSGGQMQRVAIARAIVNDPDIILADEPTGALDSETSVQVMDILKELSKTRLVVMVTHNEELAHEYSTRIISLKDGEIVNDTMPFNDEEAEEEGKKEAEKNVGKKKKKPSMSFLTALSLSLNNLFTKKGRTILTAFAGSIGIIGIALILSLSAGFNTYIQNVQRDTLSNYPVTISSKTVNYSSMLTSFMGASKHDGKEFPSGETVTSQNVIADMLTNLVSSVGTNDLKSFKKYLDENLDERYINAVQYTYNLQSELYSKDKDRRLYPVQLPKFSDLIGPSADNYQAFYDNFKNLMMSKPIVSEMIDNDKLIKNQYDLLAGTYPKKDTDLLLVVDNYNQISDLNLYMMGVMDDNDIEYVFKRLLIASLLKIASPDGKTPTDEEVDAEMKKKYPDLKRSSLSYTFDDLLKLEYDLVLNGQYYKFDEESYLYESVSAEEKNKIIRNDGVKLKVSGIVRLKKGVTSGCLASSLCYKKTLTDSLIAKNDTLPVIKAYERSYRAGAVGIVNPTTGEIRHRVTVDGTPDGIIMGSEKNESLSIFKSDATYDETEGKWVLKKYDGNDNPASGGEADENQKTYKQKGSALGVVDKETPSSISIYPTSFEAKDDVVKLIDDYNAKVAKEEGGDNKKIKYEDYIGLMISSITTIVNAVTYVLIAFVSTSLIVSSIMIGIITYISVLERTKEIGVLRSIGASKTDVARVFNAETIIIGLTAGLIGIGITLLLNIPINIIITNLAGLANVAALPVWGGVSLVLISVVLTVIAGLVPSRMASKKDPVIALRSE